MKIEQTLKVLRAAAALQGKIGDTEVAATLDELAAILAAYEKVELEDFVNRIAKLRASNTGKTVA